MGMSYKPSLYFFVVCFSINNLSISITGVFVDYSSSRYVIFWLSRLDSAVDTILQKTLYFIFSYIIFPL